MANKPNITAEYIRSIMEYDPETGIFTWKLRLSNRTKIGNEAGSIDKSGYKKISVKNIDLYCHRLSFLYVNGEWPSLQVDHINGNRSDNRFCNLRLVSKNQNMHNMKSKKTNKLKIKGVSKRGNKYFSQIVKSNKTFCLGYFDCPAAASFAYQIAADVHFGEYARPF